MTKRGTERKDQLFDVATRLFREKGFHNTSMQELADALGVQKSSLYYHVESKEELLLRILEEGSRLQAAQIDEIYAADICPTEKLRRALMGYATTVMEYQDLFSVYINELQSLPVEQTGQIHSVRQNYQRVLTQIIEEGIRNGCFRSTDPKIACLAVLGMLTWVHRWFSPNGELPPEEIATKMIEIALYGLVANPQASAV